MTEEERKCLKAIIVNKGNCFNDTIFCDNCPLSSICKSKGWNFSSNSVAVYHAKRILTTDFILEVDKELGE